MARDVSAMNDLARIWHTVSAWPPEQRRVLATRILHSLQEEEEPLRVAARLDELRNLEDGWLDGKGQAPSQESLDWLKTAFTQNYPDDLPRPYLYPTAEGGVQAEWTFAQHEVSLEVNPANHRAEWQRVNLKTHEEQDHDLNLDDAKEWHWLVEQIRQLSGGRP